MNQLMYKINLNLGEGHQIGSDGYKNKNRSFLLIYFTISRQIYQFGIIKKNFFYKSHFNILKNCQMQMLKKLYKII